MSGLILRRLAAGVLIAFAGCSPHRPVVAPSAAATPTPLPSMSASPHPASSPTATASALPTASPTSTPTPEPTVVLAPDVAPRILAVEMSTTQFRAGDLVSGTVRTSSNVASVEARIATYSIAVPKSSVGRFALSYQVPSVPFFLHGNYTMRFIARNARGDRTEHDVPISIH